MTWLYVWLASCLPASLFIAQCLRAGKGPKITIEEQSNGRSSEERGAKAEQETDHA